MAQHPLQADCALFGPTVVQWDHDTLKDMQSMLQKQPELKFLRQTLIELPSLWSILEGANISLPPSGLHALQELSDLATGSRRLDTASITNIHLAPLTILSQAVEFARLTGLLNPGMHGQDTGDLPELPKLHAVQGFCLGFLSSAAVSSSRSWVDLKENYSTALRIAACIGMAVEAEDQVHEDEERTASLSVTWQTDVDRAYLEACLDMYPETYVSCLTDENRITVTLRKGNLLGFSSQVEHAGMIAQPIGLNGAFHSERHAQAAKELKRLFQDQSILQLPSSSELHYPLRSNSDGRLVESGALHDIAIDTILCKRSHWFQVVKGTLQDLPLNAGLISIGRGSFMPRSLSSNKKTIPTNHTPPGPPIFTLGSSGGRSEEIAVIGMSCRFPSANSSDEFWQMLVQGNTSIGKVPLKRFDSSNINREPKDMKFWGNFLDDQTTSGFDHRFFGLSGREAKSMDPQQRLVLQVAYEALESAGYHSRSSRPSDVGFYLGAGSVDYEANIESEDATAFSAIGTLRAFLTGRALLGNECSMALAGGVNIITSPTLYQNLAAASFLSPSGSSKAFDASADGYCRGEGAGIVVLKRLSEAIADGDLVLGVIAGTAVNQGSNCSPITIPHSDSQAKLYQQALSHASVDAKDVTYVEAHGTGTPVGDPIEYKSIRMAFAGESRPGKLFLGSVKDNVGHTEGASGVAGLIKCLLMLEHGVIPKQANFVKLNPKINESEQIIIPQTAHPWSGHRVALVNNYGAAGSNAALVLREYVPVSHGHSTDELEPSKPYPLLVAAKSQENLASYISALRDWLVTYKGSFENAMFNIARRQNPSFHHRLALEARSTSDILSELETRSLTISEVKKPSDMELPIVMCFGGQNGQTVSISKQVYDSSKSLRDYLNECDKACQSLGIPSIYPGIFDSKPENSLVALHCTLFSIQYATAMAWIDSGAEIDTLVGHSFGQITALCVAGSISLIDSLKFVSGRAQLLADGCAGESGRMASLEANIDDVREIVNLVSSKTALRVEIACYNGPRSFALGGNKESMECLEKECANRGIKLRKLANTHAYHTYIVEPMLSKLKDLADSINIQAPERRLETCSEGGTWSDFTPEQITRHTRDPVHFAAAVQRVSQRLRSAIWLEAGSASPVIPMARRALEPSVEAENTFIPLDLSDSKSLSQLSGAACQLWELGSRARYWPFQDSPGNRTHISVPPYQFEKVQHWIDYKPPSVGSATITSPGIGSETPLLTRASQENLFVVNKTCTFFDLGVRGHAVRFSKPMSRFSIEDLSMDAPLGLRLEDHLHIELFDSSEGSWSFRIFTSSKAGIPETYHAGGKVRLIPPGDRILASRMELSKRLARNLPDRQIQDSVQASTVSGPMVYQIFSEVVDYAKYYQGVGSVSARGNEAVGLVKVTERPATLDCGITDPISMDNFLQVAGIHVNCLSPRHSNEVFVCTKLEEILVSEKFIQNKIDSRSWRVCSKYHQSEDKNTVTNDIFVYDALTQDLVLVLMGATFHKVTFKSLERSLSRLNEAGAPKDHTETPIDSGYQSPVTENVESSSSTDTKVTTPSTDGEAPEQAESSVLQKLRVMFSEIMEMPLDEVKPMTTLDELGVDSLMATEVLSETNKRFNLAITPIELQGFNDVQSMCLFIQPDGVSGHSKQGAEKLGQDHDPDHDQAQAQPNKQSMSVANTEAVVHGDFAELSQRYFRDVRGTMSIHAADTGFEGFCMNALLLQNELVTVYIVEAFTALGCSLGDVQEGDKIPAIPHEPTHQKLVYRLHEILEEQGLVERKNGDYFRTAHAVPSTPSATLYDSMIQKFPMHSSETKLLHTTGPRLADCLSGAASPLALIFQNASARALLEDVYTNAPMFKSATMLLAEYLTGILLRRPADSRPLRIIELGAGTGGTTKYLVKALRATGRQFTYTFTDLSTSLVAAARRKFSEYAEFMQYEGLDVEKGPDARLLGAFDVVVSSNCIHATRDLVRSTANINSLLRAGGVLGLVELTRTLPWFDLVFGLLEGWWLFNDGRRYVLANENHWDRVLHEAGFGHVDWSDGAEPESAILRVIIASSISEGGSAPSHNSTFADNAMETVVFKHVEGLDLHADIYYPAEPVEQGRQLPVALMIHGGGHIMLSRKDVRPDQTKLLLEKGFLPVSIDYRLCPEVTLQDGPMQDVADALKWARTVLPKIRLRRSDVRPDGSKVVSIGWSTGGFLALSLGWTAPRGIKAPDATLVLYCPSDYEDDFWMKPNFPAGTDAAAGQFRTDDIWDGVFEAPITRYNIAASKRAIGGWLAPSDARGRIALYMNWRGRTLHVLLQGLNRAARTEPPAPSRSLIDAVSLHPQVRNGCYTTPTFLIHPRQDDLIPIEQAHKTYTALTDAGVEAEVRVMEDVPHLFDTVRGWESNEAAAKAVRDGYDFLAKHVGL
ncbi:hypothetical protein GGR52DRAFT_583146 [Hypoxylon sp. FL1284]|nr:hypothetical protein GGR52DRAFT_583146 [Hypoxylon sp. FL1284]